LDFAEWPSWPNGDIRVIFESREHDVFIGADDLLYVFRDGTLKLEVLS
jgi:hypothetical protein